MGPGAAYLLVQVIPMNNTEFHHALISELRHPRKGRLTTSSFQNDGSLGSKTELLVGARRTLPSQHIYQE